VSTDSSASCSEQLRDTNVKPYPLVTIGLPTFNRCASLRVAVDSILAQDLSDFELVISDNASSDSTQDLCRDYSACDERVRYIRQPINQGAIPNFQTVLSKARGRYFMWLSDDDWLDPTYLSRCAAELSANADHSLVCGATKYSDEAGHEYVGVTVSAMQDSAFDRVLRFYSKVNDNGTFYGLARRDMLIEHPIPNVLGGDWLHVAKLALLGKIRTLDDVFIHRSRVGASADVRALARAQGMSERAARQPHRTIARSIVMDIGYKSEEYARLGISKRWILALRSARAVYRRFVVPDSSHDAWPVRIGKRLTRSLGFS
jgi:glycosyltransferase involved in cell wall biosynthesis